MHAPDLLRQASSDAGASGEAVDGAGEVEVGLGDPALAVGRQRQAGPCSSRGRGCRGGGRRPRPPARPARRRRSPRGSRRTRGPARARRPRGARGAPRAASTSSCARSAMPRLPRRRIPPILEPMRIVSLVPHATELLFALGLGDDVVARDARVRLTPRPPRPAAASPATSCRPASPPARSTRAVRARTEAGEAIYALDAELLRELEPDLIVTQALCAVCAVSLRRRARGGRRAPVPAPGHRAGPDDAGRDDGRRAHDRAGHRHARRRPGPHRPPAGPHRPRAARRPGRPGRPGRRARVARPGLRGGPLDAAARRAGRRRRRGRLRRASTPSRRRWDAWPPRSRRSSSPCPAATTPRARWPRRRRSPARWRRSARARVVAVDAAAYFSRPGPRLVDGLELLAHVLHPDRRRRRPRASRPRSTCALPAPAAALGDRRAG